MDEGEKALLEDEAEAFAIAEEAQKTLQQARDAVAKARQARGYYPLVARAPLHPPAVRDLLALVQKARRAQARAVHVLLVVALVTAIGNVVNAPRARKALARRALSPRGRARKEVEKARPMPRTTLWMRAMPFPTR